MNRSSIQHILCENISENIWDDSVLPTWSKRQSSQTSFSLDASEADGSSPAWRFSLPWRSSQQRHLQDMRKTACLIIAVDRATADCCYRSLFRFPLKTAEMSHSVWGAGKLTNCTHVFVCLTQLLQLCIFKLVVRLFVFMSVYFLFPEQVCSFQCSF